MRRQLNQMCYPNGKPAEKKTQRGMVIPYWAVEHDVIMKLVTNTNSTKVEDRETQRTDGGIHLRRNRQGITLSL
jgi:hypothetical protein